MIMIFKINAHWLYGNGLIVIFCGLTIRRKYQDITQNNNSKEHNYSIEKGNDDGCEFLSRYNKHLKCIELIEVILAAL